MKSTSGAHYIALDHIRAIAVLLVFVWHFIHGPNGYPVPFEGAPSWGPLVLFDEGHVGVALFMTLSGYLFAKLLEGKESIYRFFLWNRVLRLAPLLITVMLIEAGSIAIRAGDPSMGYRFLQSLPYGLVFPSWPAGGWSITTELHFYLLLPLLLVLQKRTSFSLGLIICAALTFRAWSYVSTGEVQTQGYWTIIGRIDQFILGILAFHFRTYVVRKLLLVIIIFSLFLSVYYLFDTWGGFYLLDGYPSHSPLWVVLPTIEGITFGIVIAWYDTSFLHGSGRISNAISKIGQYSYSIYLLHTFVVFHAADWVHTHLLDISNFYIALPVSFIVFAVMFPVSYLSMRYIEAPFLRLRRPYYVEARSDAA